MPDNHPLTGKNILIVDDSPVDLARMQSVLAPYNTNILPARSAENALNVCESFGPDYIFCDIVMDGDDGYEFVQRVREKGYQKTPIVMVSSKSEQSVCDYLMYIGANAYIVKPITTKKLAKVLNDIK